jgi:hypothetical protein
LVTTHQALSCLTANTLAALLPPLLLLLVVVLLRHIERALKR